MLKIICTKLGISQNGAFFNLINRFSLALFTCISAMGGAVVGAVAGAIKGPTTETGFSRGLCVGAVAGAVTAVQLVELLLNGEPFSKAALVSSLVDGKIFREWVSPAVLGAYQWQISGMEGMTEFSDILDDLNLRGLSPHSITQLGAYHFHGAIQTPPCTICLQDINNGEAARRLPCNHVFHLHCIDQWLMRQANCPICRNEIDYL